MFTPFEIMVAMRYLRSRREEVFISLVALLSLGGIAIGVATLIVVLAVMTGFHQELLGRILGLNGHITVSSYAGPMTNYDPVARQIAGIGDVVSAAPQIEGQVMVSSANGASGALVRGLSKEDLLGREILRDNIVAGAIEDLDTQSVLVGERMAQRFGLGVGDPLTLISPRGNTTAFGTVPRVMEYRIGAIFNIGMYEYDNSFIYMPLESAQSFFKLPDRVNGIEVMIRDPEQLAEARNDLISALGSEFRIFDWQNANAAFFNALKTEENVMFLILVLIIFVAAFNILSSLIMLVQTKGRDIAIMRTMGATRGMVMRIFFLAGSTVGVIGTLLGVAGGVTFALNIQSIREVLEQLTDTNLFADEIYFLSQLPAVVEPMEVFIVALCGLGFSVLATLYPSWRAARLHPVEALRYE